jgi:hypothetical protein
MTQQRFEQALWGPLQGGGQVRGLPQAAWLDRRFTRWALRFE